MVIEILCGGEPGTQTTVERGNWYVGASPKLGESQTASQESQAHELKLDHAGKVPRQYVELAGEHTDRGAQ